MHPELLRILDVAFPSYFVMLLAGFVFATASGAAWARRIGQNPDVIVDLGLTCILFGVAGARLLHVFADGYFWDYVHLCTDPSQVDWKVEQALCGPRYEGVWDSAKSVCHPQHADCFAWAKFWAGGLTFYGGLLGALLGGALSLRRDGFPLWKALDMGGFLVPMGLVFGRGGCLLAGCCFGKPTVASVGLAFPPRSPAVEAQLKAGLLQDARMWSLPVHPTQLYEGAACLAIAAFCLLYVHSRKSYDGQVFVSFLGLYAVARFLLEYLRADDRGGLWGLSTSQGIGICLLVTSVCLHVHRRRTGQPPAAAIL